MSERFSLPNSLRESLFRNTGLPYRNLIGLVLGYTASTLLLSGGVMTTSGAAKWFVGTLAVTMLLLVLVRPYHEDRVDKFAWGLLVIITLGFGVGALIFHYRGWWRWLWSQYLRIYTPHDIILESLFLLGVILGVFVVRNWAKEQKAFTDSVSGILSGTFVAAILGEILKYQGVGPVRAFAFYSLGFTISAVINLIVAALLIACYTNTRNMTCRTVLDFLYGSERSEIIDKHFLKNFKEDPDYAKRLLTDTLLGYEKLVSSEFAKKMEERRTNRRNDRVAFEKLAAGDSIEKLEARLAGLEPECAMLKVSEDEQVELESELKAIAALPKPTSDQTLRIGQINTRLAELKLQIESLSLKCNESQLKEWWELKQKLDLLKPSYYYQLVAIESDKETDEANKQEALTVSSRDRKYSVIYKEIDPTDYAAGDNSQAAEKGASAALVHEKMFRVGIAAVWQETLEYITTPGGSRQPFKYRGGSVNGLALLFGKTIVMDRDRDKRFRNPEFGEGISPGAVEQNRGLDEIDYLSYIAIPVVARRGEPTENAVGIMTIDTRLFVTRTSSELNGEPVKGRQGIYRAWLTRSKLAELGANLYEQDDKCVVYIEHLTEVITPVMELYAKCRIGAT